MHKRFFPILVSILVGALFIFSAYSKIVDIDPFEWTIAETGWFSFGVANALARLVIAVEVFLGLCFIVNWHNNKWLYIASAWLLILFNIYLLYILSTYGNNLNCGCFGKMLIMTPMEAYLKNLFLLTVIYYLNQQNISLFPRSNFYFFLSLLIVIFGVSTYSPPDFIYLDSKSDFKPFEANALDKLYENAATTLPFDYKKGKHIISIMSMHCPFCKKAARKMHSMMVQDPSLPLYNLYAGDSLELKEFLKETQAGNIPYQLCSQAEVLITISKGKFPTILWIENGKAVKESNYYQLETKDIREWINKK